ncbi:MAG: hypothetical protein JOY96_09800 [Verrucomicrobia bacterium]|nr:hypothetical protein [Verrucomicrobiota bacterium]
MSDDKEMHNMCKAIAEKLVQAGIEVQETDSDSKDLPNPNTITYAEVWFCGTADLLRPIRRFAKVVNAILEAFLSKISQDLLSLALSEAKTRFDLSAANRLNNSDTSRKKLGSQRTIFLRFSETS